MFTHSKSQINLNNSLPGILPRFLYRTQVVFLSILFAAMFGMALPAQAQTGFCSPCGPADSSPYTAGTLESFACLGDCVFLVEYRYRTCLNGAYEVVIDALTPITPDNCQGVSITQLVEQSVIGSVLQHSVAMFNIANPSTPFEVCVLMPSCMEQDPQSGLIASCTLSCCRVCYQMHLDQGTNTLMLDSYTPVYSWGGQSCVPPCTNICAAMENLAVPGPVYTPCEYGCSPCGFADPAPYSSEVVVGCVGDCRFDVSFDWRECGDPVKREMRLTGICITNGCSFVSENSIIQAAIGTVFQQAHTLFNIANPSTNTYFIDFSIPSCMAYDPGDMCFKACTDACCSNNYGLLLDANGEVTAQLYNASNGTTGNQNCSGSINGSPCLNRCSVLLEIPIGESLVHACPTPGCSEECFWKLHGNTGTDPNVNFLGTKDAKDLVVRTDDVERMRVLSSGQVGIANSSPDLDCILHVGDNNGSRLRVGSIEYIQDGSAELYLSPSSNGVGRVSPHFDCVTDLGSGARRWNNFYLCGQTITTSDMRDKSEIKTLSYGLDHILALNPVSYNISDGANTPRLGLLAQEVQTIIPEVVYDPANAVELDEDGKPLTDSQSDVRLGIAYQDLIPVLVKAMQEQQVEIQALKAAIGDDIEPTSVNNRASSYANILLEQNQPNPFAEETMIAYFVPQELAGRVELLVKNLNGQEVLPRMELEAGTPNSATLEAAQLPSGVYVYGIAVDGQLVVSKKLMLIR